MIKEVLLAIPLTFMPVNVAKAALSNVTAARQGSISLNTSQKYTETNLSLPAYMSCNYMIPTAQDYNTAGLTISQKSYIVQQSVNLENQPAGYPAPVYSNTNYIKIIYVAKIVLNTVRTETININLDAIYPNIPEQLNTADWTYKTYTFTQGSLDTTQSNNIAAALTNQEPDYITAFNNANTLYTTVNAVGTVRDSGTNITYSKVQQYAKGGIVDGTNHSGLNFTYPYIETQEPRYIAYSIEYSATDPYQYDLPQNRVNEVSFTYMPRLLNYSFVSEYIPTEEGTIDITGTIFEIVAMPFAFISQAFNFTLFAGTAYAINISRIFLTIMVLGIVLYIIRRYIS